MGYSIGYGVKLFLRKFYQNAMPKKLLDVLLIVISLLFLAAAILDRKGGYVDFPCQSALAVRKPIVENARIIWCISLWPRNVRGGGTIFSQGSSTGDQFFLEKLEEMPLHKIQVTSESLIINEMPTNVNQDYKKTYWRLTYNPWILYMSEVNVRVRNVSTSSSAILLEGDIYQRRVINPFGLFILLLGVWIISRSRNPCVICALWRKYGGRDRLIRAFVKY